MELTDEELWERLVWAQPTEVPQSWGDDYAGRTVLRGFLFVIDKDRRAKTISGIIFCEEGNETYTVGQKLNLLLSLREFIKQEQAVLIEKEALNGRQE